IKAIDPSRIATADNSLGEDWGPQYAADFTSRLGLDVTAFHESRRSNWYTAAFYGSMIGTLRSNGRPAYLQEPNSTRDATYQANDRADYYLQAVANARLLGAAAWCFHTLVATNFGDGGPPFLEDRLRAFPEPEWAFVSAPKPTGTTPGPPTGLAASVAGSTVTLAWVAPAVGSPPPTYVIVEAGSASGLSNLASFDTGSILPTLTATGVGPGTYFVRTRAKNACGLSAGSNEVVVTIR